MCDSYSEHVIRNTRLCNIVTYINQHVVRELQRVYMCERSIFIGPRIPLPYGLICVPDRSHAFPRLPGYYHAHNNYSGVLRILTEQHSSPYSSTESLYRSTPDTEYITPHSVHCPKSNVRVVSHLVGGRYNIIQKRSSPLS